MNGPGDPVLEMTVAYRCPRCMRLYTSMADYHAHRGICLSSGEKLILRQCFATFRIILPKEFRSKILTARRPNLGFTPTI